MAHTPTPDIATSTSEIRNYKAIVGRAWRNSSEWWGSADLGDSSRNRSENCIWWASADVGRAHSEDSDSSDTQDGLSAERACELPRNCDVDDCLFLGWFQSECLSMMSRR